MDTITPEKFWSTFSDGLHKKIHNDWKDNYQSATKWTRYITKILIQLGKHLHFDPEKWEISKEYYRVDVGYYKVSNPLEATYWKKLKAWDFIVAIEHENNPDTWYEEFVKLAHLNCQLKVIISYHDFSNIQSPVKNKINEVIEKIYQFQACKQINDSWLFIFGPTLNCLDRDFEAYKFDGKSVRKLPNKSILH